MRYWVGGTGNWDGTDTTHWSASSGGSGGASVPTSSDDVFFDANSGTGTATVKSGNLGCRDLDFTGYTGTFAGGTVAISPIAGDLTLGAGMTLTWTGIAYMDGVGSHVITTNGISIAFGIRLENVNGSWTLGSDLVSSSYLIHSAGNFDAENHNITLRFFNTNTAVAKVLSLGSGTWTLTNAAGYGWVVFGSLKTLNPGTATIKLTGSLIVEDVQAGGFYGGGKTYYNVWVATTGGYPSYFFDANTYNNLKVEPGSIVKFPSGKTQHASSYTFSGTAGNVVTLKSSSAGVPFYLETVKGQVSYDYLDISDSYVSKNRFFAGANSTDSGGNSGWVFAVPPTPSALDANFFAIL